MTGVRAAPSLKPCSAHALSASRRDRGGISLISLISGSSPALYTLHSSLSLLAEPHARPELVALCRSAPEQPLGRAYLSLCGGGGGLTSPCFPLLCPREPVPSKPTPGLQCLCERGQSAPGPYTALRPRRTLHLAGQLPGRCFSCYLRSRVRSRLLEGSPHKSGSGRSCLCSPEPRASLSVYPTPSARAPRLRSHGAASALRIRSSRLTSRRLASARLAAEVAYVADRGIC